MECSYDYIWQRRIHHGVRHQKGPVPFPESVEIGLEFNAALERKDKLDLSLLTNGVMLELCDFAKTVTKSTSYFLFEMLEFNFDLGVDTDNDLQCYDCARRIHNKIKLLKEQIKFKPRRWKETFALPDPNVLMSSTGSEQPGRYYPKRNKRVDVSVLTDGSKSSQPSENQKTQSNGAASVFIIKKQGRVGVKTTGDAYPFCKEVGVTLFVRPENTHREKLDPRLLTNGVMMELFDFSRVLCGTHSRIIHDLVKQNFGCEFDTTLFRLQVTKVMERKYTCLTAEDKAAFRQEPFKIQMEKREQKCKKKRKNEAELDRLIQACERRGTLRGRDSELRQTWQDIDLSYMCPVDFDSDVLSCSEETPEIVQIDSSLTRAATETKSSLSEEVKQEEDEVFVSAVSSQANSHLFNHHPTIIKSISDLFSEDQSEDIKAKTPKQKLWTRRAARSRHILQSGRVSDGFARCRQIGLDFNVGSGNKQNLDLQLLTNFVMWEIYKFATAMTKSLHTFLFEILDSSFNLVFLDELHKRNFKFYIVTKEKVLQNHPERHKAEFLSLPFPFPEVYNMPDVITDFQTGQEVEAESQSNVNSEPSSMVSGLTSQQANTEQHPFCKKLGINLWSTEEHLPNQKLDLTMLTVGAVFEILCFVRELSGSVHETVNDVLQHNFDLDLQSDATEASQVIQRWYMTQKTLMKRQKISPKVRRWLNTVVPLNGCSWLRPQPLTSNIQADRQTEACNGNAEHVKRVSSYHLCKDIGLDLDVCSKLEPKTKLDLRVLTRGVLLEMHRYVGENSQRYVPALYEILEYNFDLSSQSHRKVEFAWTFASQVMAIASKQDRKGDYLNKVVELPFEVSQSSEFKEEPEDRLYELDLGDDSDIVFVRELKPVDIEVEIE